MKIDENMLCPVCNAKLFTDEVAFCPECGAPHHKQCYLNLGHCAYEEFHGTENQWQPPKIEPPQESVPKTEEKTEIPPEFQGRVNQMPNAKENPFFKANGIEKDEDIGGETAESIAKFVGYNALRYINVFRKFATKKTKVNWNWVAFFLPEFWLISRKCYPQALLVSFASILYSVFNSLAMQNPEIMAFVQSGVVTKNVESIAFVLFALSIGYLLIRFIVAMFGDHFYKKKVYSTISQMKSEGTVSEIDFMQKGGVNLMLPMVLYFGINIVSTIITYLF